MRISNANLADVFLTTDLGASIVGIPLDARSFYILSLLLIYTGTSPTGTFFVEYSNANVSRPQDVPTDSWVRDTALDKAITAAGSSIISIANLNVLWVRFSYTRTSGTGAVSSANMCAKGV